ncbi:MAG: very short patch repair endonuclease [Candidatus Aenigmarchaeota archaeon]|nr:very short patch repair endonuclease [Candidatus Aenigmarchaeota archaeon]
MPDRITKQQRSKIMSHIRSKNTSLELYFRKLLSKDRLRGYRLHYKILGVPDIVFVSKKIAIFIDGDFWHGYNWKNLHKIPPKKYWQAKIERNIARDKRYTMQLKKEGWTVLRFWEHDVKKNPDRCIKKVKEAWKKHE